MRRFFVVCALGLALAGPALAFDEGTQDVAGRYKAGKLMSIGDVSTLMMAAERWCYNQQDNDCKWSEIYLSADADGARYETSNAWDDTVDIAYTSRGVFRDDRYICDVGFDWIPSVRAFGRDDGWAIEGRELDALRDDIRTLVSTADSTDCYDYLYRGQDEDAETLTLLQRHYAEGSDEIIEESTATLHFDKDTADGLGWYW